MPPPQGAESQPSSGSPLSKHSTKRSEQQVLGLQPDLELPWPQDREQGEQERERVREGKKKQICLVLALEPGTSLMGTSIPHV